VDYCRYVSMNGTVSYFTYRVIVTDLQAVPLGVSATTARVNTTLSYCSGSPIQPF
jgi:hypothetical protein